VNKYPGAIYKGFNSKTDARAFLHESSQKGPSPSAAASTRILVATHTPASGPSSDASPANSETEDDLDTPVPGSTQSAVVYAQGVCSNNHVDDPTLSRSAGVGVWFGEHDSRCVLAAADRSVIPKRRAET
jgi:hypothetical protein